MAFFSHAVSPRELAFARADARKRGPFARFLAALMEARRRAAEREIARYLAHTGGKLTDQIERDIEHRFLTGSGFDRRP
ncbi:MAG TPA: hypothetical protein VHD14_12615 [Pseudolabrys sp.]|jgi:hypothetical protein|nr:hypothetical protein [Pseudolabrys sp.]